MKTRSILTKCIAVITALAAFFSVSCTTSEPEIIFGFIQLVQYQGAEGPEEYFSFFILPEDEEGLENLDELFLYNDRAQLRWHIKSDEWLSYTIDGKVWIGTRSIAVKDGSLPRGVFRAVLYNKGGERHERNFTYDGNVSYPFPEISITNGIYTITSLWPVNKLVFYDNSGIYVNTIKLESLTGDISSLRLSSSARIAALWAEDEDNFCSAFTNVVSLE